MSLWCFLRTAYKPIKALQYLFSKSSANVQAISGRFTDMGYDFKARFKVQRRI